MRTGIYPPELRSTNLDVDWLYRRLGYRVLRGLDAAVGWGWARITEIASGGAGLFRNRVWLYDPRWTFRVNLPEAASGWRVNCP